MKTLSLIILAAFVCSAGEAKGNKKGNAGSGDMPSLKKFQKGTKTVRAIDGVGNNPSKPRQHWGTSDSNLLRLSTVSYGDGKKTPAGADRPSARAVSNAVSAQNGSTLNSKGVSDFIWQWGQFVDHDLDLSEGGSDGESFPIQVPAGDRFFDPSGTGTKIIPFTRTDYRLRSGVREQFNSITSYIDASNVYGSDPTRARALRALDGTGKMKTSSGNYLPFNTGGLLNAPSSAPNFFLAGDIRANEQVGLIAMHTLFVREHNYLADKIRLQDSKLSGDAVYELARAIVGAEMQAITYNEFLPALVGANALSKKSNWNASTNPGIANIFSTAAYRFGHSTVSPNLKRVGKSSLALRDTFFRPDVFASSGVGSILGGLASQRAQEVDTKIVNELRNFLFGPPGSGGFDLASLNIQRGRDHGLPSYNQARRDFGLAPKTSFNQITSDSNVAANLRAVYGDIEKVDVWVGGLAENHVAGSMLGELFHTIVVDQFERVRKGDSFFYTRRLHKDWVNFVEKQTLATIIERNTNVSVQDNVFFAN